MERERKIRAEQEARRQKFLQQRSVELDRTACQDAYQDRAPSCSLRPGASGQDAYQDRAPSCSLRPGPSAAVLVSLKNWPGLRGVVRFV